MTYRAGRAGGPSIGSGAGAASSAQPARRWSRPHLGPGRIGAIWDRLRCRTMAADQRANSTHGRQVGGAALTRAADVRTHLDGWRWPDCRPMQYARAVIPARAYRNGHETS